MPQGKIKYDQVCYLLLDIFLLPRMVGLRIITQEEYQELVPELNAALRKALGLKDK